jgi:hypothetical protein
MTDGVPQSQLIVRHSQYLHPAHGLLTDYMPMLREAKIGAFVNLRVDPPVEQVVITPEQWEVSGGTRKGHVIRHQGRAWITVKLPEPTPVAGVMLVYDYQNARRQQPFVLVEWRRKGQEFGDLERRYYWSPTGDRANWEKCSFVRRSDPYPMLRCWIWDEGTELRICPDYSPGTFELKELVLIKPTRK